MRILYSLAHPADTLASERAGHVVRASALLTALEAAGHEVVRVEAASSGESQVSVAVYRGVVKRLLPGRMARAVRDIGRVRHGRVHFRRLLKAYEDARSDVVLETYTPMNRAGATLSRRTGVPLVIDDLAPAWEDDVVYGVGIPWLANRVRRAMLQAGAPRGRGQSRVARRLLRRGHSREQGRGGRERRERTFRAGGRRRRAGAGSSDSRRPMS